MKKKMLRLIYTLVIVVIASLNFQILSSTNQKLDLSILTNISLAEGEGGGGSLHNCHYTNGNGIPFWHRDCSDCHVHFSHYGNSGHCHK